MTVYNPDIAAKFAARDMMESLNGISIRTALHRLEMVELSVVNSMIFYPAEVEDWRRPIKHLPPGTALQAIRYARELIFDNTPIDTTLAGNAHTFTLWHHQAALVDAIVRA